jgi:ribonucleotide reductase beta subunit family protein with ferritin-like domain
MSVFEESKSYRPFLYPWAVEAAKKHAIDMHWHVHQVELQDDLRQYNSKDGLKTSNVSHEVNKDIVDKVLCLFTEMDKTVAGGYTKLLPHIGNNEVRNLLLTFASREVVHQQAYALLAETFGFSDEDWLQFSEYVEMQDKIDIMEGDDVIGTDLDKAKLLVRILLGEGIGLFAAFACLLNFKRHGLFVGFNDVNQWSLADESEHVLNNIKVLAAMKESLNEGERFELSRFTTELCKLYVEAEHRFIDLVFELGDQEDLTKEDLKEYILYLSDLRRFQLGDISLGEVRKNPLEWMEWMLSGKKHDNFFEKRVTDYSHGKLAGGIDYSRYET